MRSTRVSAARSRRAELALLEIEGLTVTFGGRTVLADIDIELDRGESLGLLGESGSGKSLTALAAMGLLPSNAAVCGSVRFDRVDMIGAPWKRTRAVRGAGIGMVFQEPMTALNPMHRAVEQVAETVVAHGRSDRRSARDLAYRELDRLGIARDRAKRYPHQLSGGERQRVAIAAATILDPPLLIADEPTTALDVLRQREVLDLLHELSRERGTALMFITHDLAVMAELVERIHVLQAGSIIDRFPTVELDTKERQPHTRDLVRGARPSAAPREFSVRERTADPILSATGLRKAYRSAWPRRTVNVLNGVSLDIHEGEIVALIGPSGCGKSTLARALLFLETPDSGSIAFKGVPPSDRRGCVSSEVRRQIQLVFQDPDGSFDPRRTVGWSIGEPLGLLGQQSEADRTARVDRAITRAALDPDVASRYPHQFSGGQRQRLAIARAISVEPAVVVADEPVSALDVTVRSRILATIADLRSRLGTAILFISHDLDVVRSIADRILVMDAGTIVEEGTPAAIFGDPKHALTKRLLEAKPDLQRTLRKRQASAHAAAGTAISRHARQ